MRNWLKLKPNPFWIFLGLFLLANFIIFIPSYAFFSHKSDFLPTLKPFPKFLFWRSSIDIFRLCGDLFVLILPAILLRKTKWFKPYRFVFTVLYILMLFIFGYVAFNDGVFALKPQPYVDWLVVKDLLAYYLEQLDVKMFFIGLGCLVLFALLVFLIHLLVAHIFKALKQVNFTWKTGSILVLFFVLVAYSKYEYAAEQDKHELAIRHASQYLPELYTTAKENKASVDKIDLEKLQQTYIYDSLKLDTKPNLFFLMIESYGEICYTDSILKDVFYPYTDSLYTMLEADSIAVFSAMSEAPIVGGRSWLAYTSAMYGFDNKNMAVYNYLNEVICPEAPSLFKYFKQEGYTNYKIVSLQANSRKIPWDKYARLYSVDKWFLRPDLKYSGPGFGWQACPPDDYSLGFVHDSVVKLHSDGSPFSIFFLNQNSHLPFTPEMGPPPEDYHVWHERPKHGFPIPVSPYEDELLFRYQKSIEYQLTYISRFIQKNAGPNDLFLLMGDHQPPRMGITTTEGTANTPVHVISRNHDLAASFSEYGFEKGMNSPAQKATTHQALFSMYLRALYAQFGDGTQNLPQYMPEGVLFD